MEYPVEIDEVLSNLDITARFVSRIQSKLSKCFKFKKELKFTEVWLFGSVARGDYSFDSDIDIMLVCEETPTKEQKFILYDEEIFDELYSDVLLRSRAALNNMEEYFNECIHKDKIILYKEGI